MNKRSASPDPRSLASALSQLIALRGWANSRGNADLQSGWRAAVLEEFRDCTLPLKITRGVLQVRVDHAVQLSELMSFHRPEILKRLQHTHPEWKIKEIKFKLG